MTKDAFLAAAGKQQIVSISYLADSFFRSLKGPIACKNNVEGHFSCTGMKISVPDNVK